MNKTVVCIIVIALCIAACSTPPAAPTLIPTSSLMPPFTEEQVKAFYDGQIVFYSESPNAPGPWYTVDEAATLIQEAQNRKDHDRVNDIPFTIEAVTDPLALAFYYGFASSCLDAPVILDGNFTSTKRFSDFDCGDLTEQAVQAGYYEQNKDIP